jgi:periplasmic protein TonB
MAETKNLDAALATVPKDMDDIVFAGRNKQYGAYILRKLYDWNLGKALLIGASICLTGLAAPRIADFFAQKQEEAERFKMKEVELLPPPPMDPTEPPPPPPPEVPPPPTVTTIKFLPPEIKPDDEVTKEEPPPTVEELKEATPSEETQKGDPNASDIIVDPNDSKGTEIVNEGPADGIFTAVEVMPTPQGGMKAFYSYLSKNIQYPKAASKSNISGKVFVSLVVSETGRISDVKVVKGIGFGCDEEAVRVIAAAPPWIPGKQGGRPVKVRYTVPVNFTLQQ